MNTQTEKTTLRKMLEKQVLTLTEVLKELRKIHYDESMKVKEEIDKVEQNLKVLIDEIFKIRDILTPIKRQTAEAPIL
jgi:SHS2 domain-containing protein